MASTAKQGTMTVTSAPSHEIVIEWVTDQIRRGVYRPGDRLPTIAQLADVTETTATAVKVALIVLRDRGTVRGEPGRATYVADRPQLSR